MNATELLEAVQTMETANLVQLIGTGVTLLIAIGSGAFAIGSGLWSFFSAKCLNNTEIMRIKDHELQAIRLKYWNLWHKALLDEQNISDQALGDALDRIKAQEQAEILEYRKRKGI